MLWNKVLRSHTDQKPKNENISQSTNLQNNSQNSNIEQIERFDM
jgi:hypothetical protein